MFTAKLSSVMKITLPILLGCAIYSFGLLYFIIPNKLTEGGVTGISVLLNYGLGISPSLTTLLLNIPLFLIGWKILGGKQMIFTGLGIVALSFFLWLFELLIDKGWIVPFKTENDYILASLYAGVTLGTGLGIVFRYGGTTGGSDIIARILNIKFRWSMGQIILVSDVLIIGLSLIYIPIAKVLYTLVAVFVASKVIDFIQEGAYAARAFMIITDQAEIIAERITQEMGRGVTLIPAIGAYSKQGKNMVYCVVSRQEIRTLTLIVKSIDPKAFMVINDVHDVQGEGFGQL